MSFLCNNAAVIAVAAVASLMGWMFGGTRGGLLVPVVPWLFVFMLEVIFFFPQRHVYETTYDARERVWHDLKRDPLVWVALGFLALLLVPFVNKGLCAVCDAAAIAAGADPKPPVPFLPSCVDRIDHLNVFLWFLLALPVMIAVKHALCRRGKRLVISLIVWNGALLAVLGFVQQAMGAPGPLWSEMSGLKSNAMLGDFFSTFGYPNMAGDYFTTLFGLAVALWRDCCEQYQQKQASNVKEGDVAKTRYTFWKRHYYLIPAVIFFYAALNTLSRAAIMLVTVTAVVYFLHTFVSFLSRMHRAKKAWAAVWSLIGLAAVLFFVVMFAPEGVRREVDTLDTEVVLNRVTGKGEYHSRVATEIWKDHPVFGVGGWGYIHYCIPKMTPGELKKLQMVGGINVHNDFLQYLAEHGAVGFGAIVAMIVLLLWPVFKTWAWLIKGVRFMKKADQPPQPVQIFALPAPAFCMLTTVVATVIHSFGDCPLRSPAVLVLFFITLAAIPGFLPKMNTSHRTRD